MGLHDRDYMKYNNNTSFRSSRRKQTSRDESNNNGGLISFIVIIVIGIIAYNLYFDDAMCTSYKRFSKSNKEKVDTFFIETNAYNAYRNSIIKSIKDNYRNHEVILSSYTNADLQKMIKEVVYYGLSAYTDTGITEITSKKDIKSFNEDVNLGLSMTFDDLYNGCDIAKYVKESTVIYPSVINTVIYQMITETNK